MRKLGAVFAITVTVMLYTSACGQSEPVSAVRHSRHTGRQAAHQGRTSPARATKTGAATPTTLSTATAPVLAQTSACTAARLTPSFLSSDGATGHVLLLFALRDTSSTPCHTYGYPGLVFLTSGGKPLGVRPKRTGLDFAGTTRERAITLNPGQEASFRVITSDASGGPCEAAKAVQVIAPDDTAVMKLTLPSGISVCAGPATLSPLQPGTQANPNS